jgi:hypothetical protein
VEIILGLPSRFTALAARLMRLAVRDCNARNALIASNVPPVSAQTWSGHDASPHDRLCSSMRVEAEKTRVPCEAVVQLEPGCIPLAAQRRGVHFREEVSC